MSEPEFLCFFCRQQSDRLVFYSKLYQESGRSTIENPSLLCEKCYADPKKKGQLFASRGGWEGIHCRTFKEIVAMPDKALGIFLSKSGKEKNDLANKTWRKRIFRIHYKMKEKK